MLKPKLGWDILEDPPYLRYLELVEDRTHGVHDVLVLLRGMASSSRHGTGDGQRAWFNLGIKSRGLETQVLEQLGVEHDARFEKEALADHPSERDAREAVTDLVGYGSTADIYSRT